MKWTENGITYEGTVAEYMELRTALAISAPVKRNYAKRTGKSITVIDLGEQEHKFSSIKDAASYISTKAQRNVSAQSLCKRSSDTLRLSDYMSTNKPWNPNKPQENTANV